MPLIGSAIGSARLTYPKGAVLFHMYATVVIGHSVHAAASVNQFFCHYAYQSNAGNNDTLVQQVYLASGSYTLKFVGRKNYCYAMIDWYIDNVKVVSGQDWYSPGVVYNVTQTASVTVHGNGQHELKGVVNGKNALSSGYYLVLTAIAFI